jgi:hypothetical protein
LVWKRDRQWLRSEERERGAVAEDRERQSRVYLFVIVGKKKTKRWDLTPFGLER